MSLEALEGLEAISNGLWLIWESQNQIVKEGNDHESEIM